MAGQRISKFFVAVARTGKTELVISIFAKLPNVKMRTALKIYKSRLSEHYKDEFYRGRIMNVAEMYAQLHTENNAGFNTSYFDTFHKMTDKEVKRYKAGVEAKAKADVEAIVKAFEGVKNEPI